MATSVLRALVHRILNWNGCMSLKRAGVIVLRLVGEDLDGFEVVPPMSALTRMP